MQGVFRIGENIGDLNGFPLQQNSRDHTLASRCKRLGLYKLIVLSRVTVARRVVIRADMLLAHDRGLIRLTQLRRRLDQRVKHWLQIESRAADHLEHVGGGGLLLQRLPQLVEQARVLDGDDGLAGEISNKVNLLLVERTDLLAVNAERTNQLVLFEHRYCEYSPCTAVNDDSRRGIGWWDIHVILFGANIGDMDRMLRLSDSRETGCRPRTNNRLAASLLRQPRRRTVQCGDAVLSFPLPQVQHAELGLAEPRRVRKYALEHGP